MNKYVLIVTLIGLCFVSSDYTTAEEVRCKANGKFPYMNDKTKYNECYFIGDGKFTHSVHTCPADTCFHTIKQHCDVDACEESVMTGENPPFFTCPSVGRFPHVNSTRKDSYYDCIQIHGIVYAYEYRCLPYTPCFNPIKEKCIPSLSC